MEILVVYCKSLKKYASKVLGKNSELHYENAGSSLENFNNFNKK